MEKIQWLQISDLHIFDSTNWDLMKNAYERQLSNKKIDFLIITGDLHQYGDDYCKTLEFLENLVSLLNLEKKDVFIVPGNHDVEDIKYKKLIVKHICDQVETDEDTYIEYIDDLRTGYAAYRKFLRKFYGVNNPEAEKVIDGQHMFTWNNRINLLALNSTFICNGKRDHKQILNIQTLARTKIVNGLPTLICAHHSPHDLFKKHLNVLKRIITDNKISAYLCGDLHLLENGTIESPNISVPYIVCNKSAVEPRDKYSQMGFILYSWDYSDSENKVSYRPYLWDEILYRFEPCSQLDDDEFNSPYFIFKNADNGIKEKIVEKREEAGDETSIWLPDAELATGTQTRFNNFTKTPDVNDFLKDDSSYWGISSVKGIGKTFLLQVRRVKMSQKAICFPYVKTPCKDNDWATERVQLDELIISSNKPNHLEMKLIWKYSITNYIVHCWIKMEQNKPKSRRCEKYPEIIKTIDTYKETGEICDRTEDYLCDSAYSSLSRIMENLLKQSNWRQVIQNDYSAVGRIANKVVDALANKRRSTLVLFFDKLDQAFRQPNSEQPLDCDECSKQESVEKCTNPQKGTKYCYGIGDDICSNRLRCCYGCTNFSNAFAGNNLKLYSEANQMNLSHINYWQRIQLALVEAIYDIKAEYRGNIKIIYTVRREAFNCEDNIFGENRAKIMGLTKELKYTKADYKKIFEECIKKQDPALLYDADLLKCGKVEEAFVGIERICHPYVDNCTESIFDIIYRHSFDRTRDIQEYGEALTKCIEEIREEIDENERGQIVKRIIEDTAAKLAFNSNKATNSSENSYYFEKLPIIPSFWADSQNFQRFIMCIDRNLLFNDDIKAICKEVNCRSDCPDDMCKSCRHHPFSMLYNLGLLGFVSKDDSGLAHKQTFLDACDVTYFHEDNVLPIKANTLYILHPALTKSIDALKKHKIKHFSGFLLGKDISVDQTVISKIINDRNTMERSDFEHKYYRNFIE